ncbi:hypothetical protein TNCV_3332301 [Trichonephila clavipes]|nr:hypothetical protein TNCV_3332301 [Trichonephila clavipes]
MSPSQYGGYDPRLVTEWVRIPKSVRWKSQSYMRDTADTIERPQGSVDHGLRTAVLEDTIAVSVHEVHEWLQMNSR